MTKLPTTDYFDRVAGITRDRHDVLMKRLARYGRKQQGDGRRKFAEFAKEWLDGQAIEAVKAIAALPLREDGQPDLSAVGMTPAEFAMQLSKDLGLDADDMLERFLDSEESPAATERQR